MLNGRILPLALILGSVLFPAACLSWESTAESSNERAVKRIDRIHKRCVKEIARVSRQKMKESTMQALHGAHTRSVLGLIPQKDLDVQSICQDEPKVTHTADLRSDTQVAVSEAGAEGGHDLRLFSRGDNGDCPAEVRGRGFQPREGTGARRHPGGCR